MRAALVSVEYADLLAITLPYNRHHFDDVLIVTTPGDAETQRVAVDNKSQVFTTDAFYRDGALFNKWLALEEGLDWYGRHGVMCLMDADILWPKIVDHWNYQPGYLYTPIRHLWLDVTEPAPPDALWRRLPTGGDSEWAGYTQVFWATDQHLPSRPPWHATNWRHAGGADSFFQQRWPAANKLRPSFVVLHLGAPGANWAGRATRRTDGTLPELAHKRRRLLAQLLAQRRAAPGADRYAFERIPPQ